LVLVFLLLYYCFTCLAPACLPDAVLIQRPNPISIGIVGSIVNQLCNKGARL
jgi:hypothetical protein